MASAKAVSTVRIIWGPYAAQVKLISPIEDNDLKFNNIHSECLSQLKQGPMYCPTCNRSVERPEIVLGYKLQEGEFVIVSEDDRAKAASTKDIELSFAPSSSLDPIYFRSSYYLIPEKGHVKNFTLFRCTLATTGLVGIGRYATRGKDSAVALRPYGVSGLIMHQLFFEDSIRPYELEETDQVNLTTDDLSLATKYALEHYESFDPSQYKDTVREETLRVIQEKRKSSHY